MNTESAASCGKGYEKRPQCWTLRERAEQITLDQKHACQVPLTASNVKTSHLHYFCYQKEPRLSMA